MAKGFEPMRFLSSLNKKRLALVVALIASLSVGGYFGYQHLQQPTFARHLAQVPEVVQGNVVTLKQLREEYFVDYHNVFSNIVRKNFEYPPVINLGWSIAYLKGEMEKAKSREMLMYVIFDNKENKLIGALEIREINPLDPGQLGCWVNENYWGKGRFQEALKLISRTYFALHPTVNEYNAYVRLWNKRSYHALKKFGFKDADFAYDDKGEKTYHILIITRDQIMK